MIDTPRELFLRKYFFAFSCRTAVHESPLRTDSPMQPKLKSLESLRGLAAVGVVFFHFRMHSSFDNRFVQDLWLMVDFFFVLSGFVMTLAYADRLANRRQFFEFAKKRFFRLYPLHILVLLAWVALEFSTLLAVNHLGYAA